jgi:hypothetical protein
VPPKYGTSDTAPRRRSSRRTRTNALTRTIPSGTVVAVSCCGIVRCG